MSTGPGFLTRTLIGFSISCLSPLLLKITNLTFIKHAFTLINLPLSESVAFVLPVEAKQKSLERCGSIYFKHNEVEVTADSTPLQSRQAVGADAESLRGVDLGVTCGDMEAEAMSVSGT